MIWENECIFSPTLPGSRRVYSSVASYAKQGRYTIASMPAGVSIVNHADDRCTVWASGATANLRDDDVKIVTYAAGRERRCSSKRC